MILDGSSSDSGSIPRGVADSPEFEGIPNGTNVEDSLATGSTWSESVAMGTTVQLCLVDTIDRGDSGDAGVPGRGVGVSDAAQVSGAPSVSDTGGAASLHALVAEVDDALSRFRAGSDVSRLNSSPGEWIPVGDHLVAVAEASERYRVLTSGVFNAVVPLTSEDESGFGKVVAIDPQGDRSAPLGVSQGTDSAGEDAPRLLRSVSKPTTAPHSEDSVSGKASELLRWRRTEGGWEARLAPGYEVDFGAIAKGYAADLVRDRGGAGLLVSIGTSSISFSAPAPSREGWRIAIGSPWSAVDETLGYLTVPQGSFSMSGVRGGRIGSGNLVVPHVRDPRTGGSAETDVCAVGILSDDGMRSEALSTAFLVLGLEQGMNLCQRLPADALFLTGDGRIVATRGMAPFVSLRRGLLERLAALRV